MVPAAVQLKIAVPIEERRTRNEERGTKNEQKRYPSVVKIEHTAYQVEDPVALARWYVAHLGMTVKRSQHTSPFGHFLADSAGLLQLGGHG